MRLTQLFVRRGAAASCALVLGLAVAAGPAAGADEKSYVMKMSTATLNDVQHEWIKEFVAAVEKDSGGRIKGEIYPASQLGSIPRQIEGTQFGSIQGWVGPPEFLAGIDPRFEIMSSPGLVTGMDHGRRVAADPAIQSMMLGLGADKGLHGVGLFASQPSAMIARTAIRHLADFKGRKIRVLASQFQEELISRFGGTPVAMTLGDVLPAIQQGAIDGAVGAVPVFTTMQYYDAAKYITETGQPFIFSIVVTSKKWYDGLPPDLRKIIDDEGAKTGLAVGPWQLDFYAKQRKLWTEKGGELIALPPDEQASMMKTLASVGGDLSKSKPALAEAYKTLVASVTRNK
ncbi:MAG TPA: TRAP transporter substrate-binding protein [Stellaceae bacterium]|nr:TRAP transporter substrate-binding protein [Stellaceae bacterium]